VSRAIRQRYDDPLDLIWLECARSLDLTIVRSDEVYASFDGERTLTLSTSAHFDPDDSLAQLIFHELCHALVAGRRKTLPDWGMANTDERDLLQEHACHRVQSALADRYGLRALLAVTTDHRAYWDALPIDPLGPGDDEAIPLARDAFERGTEGPWAGAITRALASTAALAAVMRKLELPADSLWRATRPLHASGFPQGTDGLRTCGDCAWSHGSASRLRCRQTDRATRIGATLTACVRFEPKLDQDACGACGACCREGFDRVELSARDLVKKRHPELVTVDGFGPHLARPLGRCVALEPPKDGAPYRCRVYAERPRACADFPIASDACLTARRRVGLSV